MEDQRNWTDASLKTYSTPLELPFPVKLAAGEQIRQRAVLTLVEQGVISVAEEPTVKVAIVPGSQTKRVPKIGLCVTPDALPYSAMDRERLAHLRLNHLRVDLRFSDSSWKLSCVELKMRRLRSAPGCSARCS